MAANGWLCAQMRAWSSGEGAVRKSPDAFRTISEVAQELDLPQHVLRFWETRFSQIKPMKRGGGRRYYRPDDVELLRGIRHLLYGEGYTIKGVQRILKEQGVRHVIEAFPGHVSNPEAEIVAGEAGQIEGVQIDINPAHSPAQHPQNEPLVQPQQRDIVAGNGVTPAESVEPVTPVPAASPAMTQPDPAPAVQVTPIVQATVPQTSIQQPQSLQSVAPQVEQPAVHQESDATRSVPATPNVEVPSRVTPAVGQVEASNRQTSEGMHAHTLQSQPTPAAPSVTASQPLSAPVAPPKATDAPLFAQVGHAENTAQSLNNSAAPASIMAPHVTQPAPMPQDLSQGEPVYQQGQEAAFSVEAGRNSLLQENKSGFFSRLRGKNVTDEMVAPAEAGTAAGMPRDDVRRLQSTLFELLECKRILDQARNSS